jgi:hypothetical protein
MKRFQLAALRDFAISHFPRAQTADTSLPPDDYKRTLYGFAALISPNAPATECAAAALLQPVMQLSIDWAPADMPTPAQRQQSIQNAVEAAHELSSLTGTQPLPWLADFATAAPAAPVEPAGPVAQPAPAIPMLAERPLLQPGPTQTTEDAARYLGLSVGYMRKWNMMGTGPITAIKKGSRLGWPTADLERLARDGWKSRGTYKK